MIQRLNVRRRFALICELTHRCPLHCTYCSNPLATDAVGAESWTPPDWQSALQRQAAETGSAARALNRRRAAGASDLAELMSGAHAVPPLHQPDHHLASAFRTSAGSMLVEAGLDHIQLSFQDSNETRRTGSPEPEHTSTR